MSDAAPQAGRPEDLGVVDPIRLPGSARKAAATATAAWDRLPLLGQVFVVLAIVDILGRATGVLGSLYLDAGVPLSFITAFVPHDLLILLPALVVARRPDAMAATPLIVHGAVALAVVEFASGPLSSMNFGGDDPVGWWTTVTAASSLGMGAGLLSIAIGLTALNPPSPTPFLAGLANLFAALIAGAGITSLAILLVTPGADVGDPGWNAMLAITSALSVLVTFGWAMLARAVIRGFGDTRRSGAATSVGAIGVGLHAAMAFLTTAIGLVVIAQIVFALPTGLVDGSFGAMVIESTVAPTLVVIAFGLGLGDTSVRIPRRGPELTSRPRRDPVQWPTSFEEQDVPYHPELVPEREQVAVEQPPAQARGRRGRGRKRGGAGGAQG